MNAVMRLGVWLLVGALAAPSFAWADEVIDWKDTGVSVPAEDSDASEAEKNTKAAADTPSDAPVAGDAPTANIIEDGDAHEAAAAAADEANNIEPAAGLNSNGDVLSSADEAAYRKMFKDARAGKEVNAGAVKSRILMGYVKAAGLMSGGASFGALNGWLRDYRDLAPAGEIYRLADARRERPKQVCTSTKVAGKAAKGSKKKPKAKTVKTCKTVGKLGPAAIRPLAMELKEEKQRAREEAAQGRLSKLSSEGRRILAASWRARVRGDFGSALTILMASGARDEAGEQNWQSELVKVASFYHGKREWKYVLRAAEPAVEVKGPNRDEALWLAGFASYRLGQVRNAADYWDDLAKNEPAGSPHAARASWWAARAYAELGQNSKVKDLLKLGTRDQVGFYGQLCAAKLGQSSDLSWGVPGVSREDEAKLLKVPAARRALALAQVGETAWAQQEFKMADDDLPYQATRALASLAVQKQLPAVALQAGKDLLQRGEVMAGALFPLPEQWKPRGGTWQFDRALMTGIMRQESAFQPGIGSWAGAQGLMQIMPATGAYVARMGGHATPSRADLHNPEINLMLAQDYLNHLSGELEGNLMLVVAAYNGGIGNVKRWLDRGVTPGGDPVLWLESIPFDETRDYVEKVFANYWVYQQRMGVKVWSLQSLADGYWPLQWKRQAAVSGGGDAGI